MEEFKFNETEGHYIGLLIDQEEFILSIVNQEQIEDRKSIPINKNNISHFIELLTTINENHMQ